MRKRIRSVDSARAKERSAIIREKHDEIRRNLQERAERESSTRPLKVEYVLSILNKIKDQTSVIMSEGVTYEPVIESYIESQMTGTFFASGGSSLGDGLGNALGLKLASPNRDIICLIGDGGYVYSNPTAVFWTATKYRIPIVAMILNNGGYEAMKRAVERSYPEGWSKKNDYYSGVRIDPQPNYALAAEACGAVGFRI